MNSRWLHRLLVAASGFIALSAQANVLYTFDSDAQGLTPFDGGNLTWQATGGNSGGWLSLQDSGDGDMRLVLPSASLGDWSSYLGGTLSFDAKNINNDQPDYFSFGQVAITGTAGTITLDLGGSSQPPTDGLWHHYSTVLDTATWGSNLPSVLGNVTDVKITLEFHNGVTETAGFDNFSVASAAAVPEPSSAMLVIAGVAGLAWAARRQRR